MAKKKFLKAFIIFRESEKKHDKLFPSLKKNQHQ
jgi:hypothetical protein